MRESLDNQEFGVRYFKNKTFYVLDWKKVFSEDVRPTSYIDY